MTELERALYKNDLKALKKLLKKDTTLNIRISSALKDTAEKYLKKEGYRGFSEFIEENLMSFIQEKLDKEKQG